MEPSVNGGDFILVERMSYLFSKSRVGHVVIAKHPQKPNTLLLKRVVRKKGGHVLDRRGYFFKKHRQSALWMGRKRVYCGKNNNKDGKSPPLKNERGDPHTFAKKWWGSYPQDRSLCSCYNVII